MKLAVDLMGSDLGPESIAKGLITIAKRYPYTQFFAVGTAEVFASFFTEKQENIQLVLCQCHITMDMSVSVAGKLKDKSSMGVAIQLLKSKTVDACLSAGNTAVLMALSYLILKTEEGIRRPSIMSSLIYNGHRTLITDLGANLIFKAEDFLNNAKLAAELSSSESPRIALLNVGKEEGKGTPVLKEAHALLKNTYKHYIGFIEGSDVLLNKADIILCDGFVGNCVTKVIESFIAVFKSKVVDSKSLPATSPVACFLGLNGTVYKAHGNSDVLAIESALQYILNEEAIAIKA